MKKLFLIVILAGVLGLGGWRLYQKLGGTQEAGRRPGGSAVPVAVEPVRTEAIRDVAEFTGTLLPKSRFIVAPKVAGRLEKLLVQIGDTVRQGDLVATLDSEEYTQQVAQARAELEVSLANLADCRSALDVASREFDRAKQLRQQKVTSEAELDEAQARHRACEAKHEVAQAQIKQKEAALKAAEVRLSYTQIRATWEDSDTPRAIAERFVDQGAMLRANDPIVSVVDLSSVIAVVYVIERDFPAIQVGQAAMVATDAYADREFTGRIVRRAPVLKEESRQARVEIEVPNADGLLAPGMFARVHVQFAEHENATVVPVSALVRRNGGQGVFLADGKEEKARFVPVKVGIVNGEAAEVLEPPLAGMVVTLGQHLLEDGSSILLPGAGPLAPSDAPPGGAKEGRP